MNKKKIQIININNAKYLLKEKKGIIAIIDKIKSKRESYYNSSSKRKTIKVIHICFAKRKKEHLSIGSRC